MRMAGVTNAEDWLSKQLEDEVSSMELEETVPLARTFSAYLNLMGIAETHHRLASVNSSFCFNAYLMSICGFMAKRGISFKLIV